jgi:hypothetical protein
MLNEEYYFIALFYKIFYFPSQNSVLLKILLFEIFKFSEDNIISVEAAKNTTSVVQQKCLG